MINLRNKRFEWWPLEEQQLEFVWFEACNGSKFLYEACRVDWRRNWSSNALESNRFWICHGCFQASMNKTGTVCYGSTSKLAQWYFKMMNQPREMDIVWRDCKKFERKSLKNFDLDLKKWIVNPWKQLGFWFIYAMLIMFH